MDKTCGTCKYRGEPITKLNTETYEHEPTSYFLCDRIKHINKELRNENYLPGLKAGVMDGSGYQAALCVESDFGCNQWEAK